PSPLFFLADQFETRRPGVGEASAAGRSQRLRSRGGRGDGAGERVRPGGGERAVVRGERAGRAPRVEQPRLLDGRRDPRLSSPRASSRRSRRSELLWLQPRILIVMLRSGNQFLIHRILDLFMGRKRTLQNLKISSSGHILFQNVPIIFVQQYKEWFLHICWVHHKRFLKLLLCASNVNGVLST
ncbi:unnamed protein product, partial [Urochloa humidicola]